MANKLLLTVLAIYRLIVTVGLTISPTEPFQLGAIRLSTDSAELEEASVDFGRLGRAEPIAVFRPSSAHDVAGLVKAATSGVGFPVSARGHGHSINGQAHTGDGVVVEMGRRKAENGNGYGSGAVVPKVNVEEEYVDVWGGELWVDVLRCTLEVGLAPRSWTDYLYLTVGGTLSNAGISGQAFNYGPQIRKGKIVTCSEEKSPELFHAVLGGLGQFGIITRARIALEPSPQRVRWIRVLYSNFTAFTKDQEYLISLHDKPKSQKFDYVEGFVIVDEGLINNWRSSFFSPSNPVKISSLGTNNEGVLYCLEITKNYFDSQNYSVDQEIETLLKDLDYIPASEFTTDLPYIDFLDRVHKAELKLRSKGLWEVPHPWLNLFVPKSRISDFNEGVFKGILGNKTSGPILIYPMNKHKWDNRTSVVTPNEEVFYLVALLRSALENGEETQSLEYLTDQNRRILKFCKDANIGIKQYLPHYTTESEWINHFGDKWEHFNKMKTEFDPKRILATGQRIFKPIFDTNDVAFR
ncbi:hypothetical protein KSS87_016118 [Heliosperma pusillum]|nr:hypothetical protein KSS87_016118 [Heliosperma pusillum]